MEFQGGGGSKIRALGNIVLSLIMIKTERAHFENGVLLGSLHTWEDRDFYGV